MILVTLGTQDKQFTRLLKAIDNAIDKGIIKRTIPNHPRSRNQMYYTSEDYKKENENEQNNN